MQHPLADMLVAEVNKKVTLLEEELKRKEERLAQYEQLVAVFDKQLGKLIYLGYEDESLKSLYRVNRTNAVEMHLDRFKRKAASLLAMIRLVRTS